MTAERLQEIISNYPKLRVAVVGDFCLDRYLEIDTTREETSIETGLPVHNVTRVRAQPGGAGTVLNNLAALGAGEIFAVGFCGDDGEGYELRRALGDLPGVNLTHFFTTPLRRTFTYCKPLLMQSGQAPRELNRLDSKNWTPTPDEVNQQIISSLDAIRDVADIVIVLDQVESAGTGVISASLLEKLSEFPVPVIADSRRGLSGYPPVIFKMNAAELSALLNVGEHIGMREMEEAIATLVQRNNRPAFVSMAEGGILGAFPGSKPEHVPALPVRGPIDVVGAGDSVTANLALTLASGASAREAMTLAMLAASVVVHQLGTTGTATPRDLTELHSQTRRANNSTETTSLVQPC